MSSLFVKIVASDLGTDPLKVVESAIAIFESTREFDKVFVVFDRDEHLGYANAINKAESKNGRIRNSDGKTVEFHAIVSVPSFELWLLLHYSDIQSWFHRDVIYTKLKTFIENYSKGSLGIFAITEQHLSTAIDRGSRLKSLHCRLPGDEAYTDVQDLVDTLLGLRKQ